MYRVGYWNTDENKDDKLDIFAIKKRQVDTDDSNDAKIRIFSGANDFKQPSLLKTKGTLLDNLGIKYEYLVGDWKKDEDDGTLDIITVSKDEVNTDKVTVFHGITHPEGGGEQYFMSEFPPLKASSLNNLDGDEYTFKTDDWNKDGVLDVIAIKNKQAGEDAKARIFSGVNSEVLLNTKATGGSGLDEFGRNYDFEVGDWDNDGIPDIFAIHKKDTKNGFVEVFIFLGKYNFKEREEEVVKPTCEDTDGGEVIYEKGFITIDDKEIPDYCVPDTDKVLKEGICIEGRNIHKDITCKNGCEHGACIEPEEELKCTDCGDDGRTCTESVCEDGDFGNCEFRTEVKADEDMEVCVEKEEAPPIEECELTPASWSKTKAIEGETVKLIVKGNDECNGKTAEFEIRDYDPFNRDDRVNFNPDSARFNKGKAVTIWTTEYNKDPKSDPDPEYYFKAEVDGESIKSSKKESELLKVTKEPKESCDGIQHDKCTYEFPNAYKYCDNGNLDWNPDKCGCPPNYIIAGDECRPKPGQ